MANFADIQGELWPLDNTPRVLNRVLINFNFAAAYRSDEVARCTLITEFCDSVLRENACRALAQEAPLTYRQAKERWTDVMERLPATPSSGHNSRGGTFGGSARGVFRGGRGAFNINPRAGAQNFNRQARFFAGGLSHPVCFNYNKQSGCPNPAPGLGCDDKRGGIFAHVCNYLDRATNKYCLAAHSRHNNH